MTETKKRPLSALERARQQAAVQAEAFALREKQLTGLAVEYLMAGSALERALEQIERRMEPLRVEQGEAEDVAQRARVGAVARMRALEASEQEVAARLGISLGEVRRSMALSRSWASDGGQGDQGGGGQLAQPGPGRQVDAEQAAVEAKRAAVEAREGGGELAPPLPDAPDEPAPGPGLEGWASWSEPGAGQ